MALRLLVRMLWLEALPACVQQLNKCLEHARTQFLVILQQLQATTHSGRRKMSGWKDNSQSGCQRCLPPMCAALRHDHQGDHKPEGPVQQDKCRNTGCLY